MLRFVLGKAAYSIPVLFGVVSLVFLLFNVLPADPARLVMGQRSDEASLQNARKELRLDMPVPKRYLLYLNDISPISMHEDNAANAASYNYTRLLPLGKNVLVLKTPQLGRSYRTKKNVAEAIGEALPGTMILAFSAMLLATVLGIGLGVFAALNKDNFWDKSALLAGIAGISLPSFFAGLLVAYVFAYLLHAYTGLNMTGSLWEYDPLTGESRPVLKNLILPAFALGIRPLAVIMQLTRSSVLDILGQDFVRTAYAKGLSRGQVIWHHVLPNALNPVVTAISGWMAELLAGSFFVEYIFGWKGLGKLTVDALEKFDFPIVTGAVLVSACIFVVVSFMADVVYALLDPRIRL